MKTQPFLRIFRRISPNASSNATPKSRSRLRLHPQCLRQQFVRHLGGGPGGEIDPNFVSILDRPAKMARVGKQHGPGLIILALIPITAFGLGCWQVKRLGWKTDLIARFEDRLTFPPLELPLRIDPDAVRDFDYRKVYATGVLRHDQEILIGPRMHEGQEGYSVVTPLEREENGVKSKILVCRGWINKDTKAQWFRKKNGALPEGPVRVEGLLREPPKGNMFTPQNSPEEGIWHFPDVEQMAKWTGSQPVWVEETMDPDLLVSYEREPRGVPIGRPAAVNLRNNHTQYIFTWYALSLATSVMFYMVVKKPLSGSQRRVRHSIDWS